MPRGDGTGPAGRGPMSGQGQGFCVLKTDFERPASIEGFAGLEGRPVHLPNEDGKEVIKMPAGDGTGPAGMGPMTGRAAGFCAGYPAPGFRGAGRGFGGRGGGRGFGRGFGRGWGRWAMPYSGYAPYSSPPASYTAPTREQELEILKSQSEGFQQALEDIQKRISELEGKEA